MAILTRDPSSFDASSGTWSSTEPAIINDYPDSSSTYLTHGTTAGNATWNISAPTVPTGATNISVSVKFYSEKTASPGCNMGGRIKIGSNYYNGSTQAQSTSPTLYTTQWTTNPATSAAWTASEANAIAAIGVVSTDASPTIYLYSVLLEITYTPEITGSGSITLGSLTCSATGTVGTTEATGTADITLSALTSSAIGAVNISGAAGIDLASLTANGAGAAAITGTAVITLDALTGSGAGEVDIAGVGSITLGAVTTLAAGIVAVDGHGSIALGALTLSGTGVVGSTPITGTADISLGVLTASSVGTVAVVGAGTMTLGALTLSAAGTVSYPGVSGEANITLGLLASDSTGTVQVSGAAVITLAALILATTGSVPVDHIPGLARVSDAAGFSVSGATSSSRSLEGTGLGNLRVTGGDERYG
jgi:hypothetical protein